MTSRLLPALVLLTVGALALALAAPARAQTTRTLTGTGSAGSSGDGGVPSLAALNSPAGVHGDAAGQVWIADAGNHRIRRVTAAFDSILAFAGTGTAGYTGDGGAATAATLNAPSDVFVDSAGVVYVADTGNHVVRRIATDGVITTLAGTGAPGDSGDGGAATQAQLNSPTGVWASNAGVVFIADRGNHRVRRVSAAGTITTFAGTGSAGFGGDGGSATAARLSSPADVYMDTAGVLYVADSGNHRVRVIAADSTITTFAGTGSAGFSGDGGAATQARLAFPRAVFVDTVGSLYIADRFNHRVRRVNPSGNITTLMGDGTPGDAGDYAAANRARLSSPSGVWLRDGRQVVVSDAGNHRVRWVDDDNVHALAGVDTVGRTAEVRLLSMAFTGDGVTGIKGLRLTVSDRDTATGLTTADFSAFRLYESADSVLSVDTDELLGSLDPEQVTLGEPFTLQTSASPVPAADQRRFFLVSAVISDVAVEGHAFRVAVPTGGLSTSIGGHGMAVRAADSARVDVDIVATRLVFATQPDGVISGNPLTRQPVVHAVDDLGYVDGDFTDLVTLTVSGGSGSLLQGTTTAAAGVATFTGVTYAASVDDEAFALVADDAAGGPEGDLPTVTSNTLTANLVNDPPSVRTLSFVINEDDSVTVPVTAMISDPDDSLSSLDITFTAQHTSATIRGTDLTIRPDPDFAGVDTLRIAVEDPFGATASGRVPLTVRGVNDLPVLQPIGRRVIDEDDTLEVDLFARVSDVETPDAAMGWVFEPSAGLQTDFDAAAGLLRVHAPADSSGTFFLQVTAVDGQGSPTSIVDTVTVAAVNDAPRWSLPTDLVLLRGDVLELDLADWVHDPEDADDDLAWSTPAVAGVTVTRLGSRLTLSPATGFGGVARVTVVATDPAGAAGTDTLKVTVTSADPQAPVLSDLGSATVEVGDTLRQVLSTWVTDADHEDAVLTWVASTDAAGSAAVAGDTLIYLPAGSTPYDAILAITVTDPDGLSDSGTLTVQVVEPQPLLADVPDTLTVGVDGSEWRLDDYVRDPAQAPQVTWTATVTGDLEVRIDGDRLLRVAPAQGSRAGGGIALRAQRGDEVGTDTVTVVVANSAPRVDLPDLFLDAGESASLRLDDFVVDDGGPEALTWVATPLDAGLSAGLNATLRTATLSAVETAAGDLRVAFAAVDLQGAVGADTVTVTVRAPGDSDTTATDTSGTNTAPVIGDLPLKRLVAGAATVLDLDGVVTDDGDVEALRWTADAGPGLAAGIDGERRLTVTADPDFDGATSVHLTATDAFGARASAHLVVEVTRVTGTPEPGDFDGDGVLDLFDFYRFADHVGTSVYTENWDPVYDLNDDGRVGFDDFFLFADLYDRAQRP